MAPKAISTSSDSSVPKPTSKNVQPDGTKAVNTPIKKKQKPVVTPKRTPICKDKKPVAGHCNTSSKKLWKRRPMPAHSGVPVPNKMKALLAKRLQDLDVSL